MQKLLLSLTFFAIYLSLFAQDKENIFLKREFWQANPSIELIKAKIAEGNDPCQQDEFGFDAVSYGIIDNTNNESLQYLLTLENNKVSKPTHGGVTYLLWAAYKGNLALMSHLIDLGSDINFTTNRGTNILLMSGFGSQVDTILYNFMFHNGVDVNSSNSNETNILLALAGSDANNKSTFDFLINKGLNWNYLDKEGNGFFHYAARAGNISNMKLALDKQIDFQLINNNEENAIFFASYGRKRSEVILQTFTFLDSLGLNPNSVNIDGQTPLHHAVKRGNIDVINFLINRGLNVNQIDHQGNTAFMNSVLGKVENVRRLLPLSKNINHVNKDGHSALSNSVRYFKKDAFDFLIENGADLKVINNEGEDLIGLCFKNYSKRRKENFEHIVGVLSNKGVVAKTNYSLGNTLIHYAIEKNSLFLVKKALEMNIDPNQKNDMGLTSLHLSAMKATNNEIIDVLIAAGADKSILTDFGESSYDLASENEILISNKTDISLLQVNN